MWPASPAGHITGNGVQAFPVFCSEKKQKFLFAGNVVAVLRFPLQIFMLNIMKIMINI